MRVVVCCKSCKQSTAIKKRATDRYKLSQKLGEEFAWKCPKCSTKNHFSVDDVSAENGLRGLIFFLISLLMIAGGFIFLRQYFSISLWWLIPLLIAIPSSFYAAVTKEENNQIRAFNRYKLRS